MENPNHPFYIVLLDVPQEKCDEFSRMKYTRMEYRYQILIERHPETGRGALVITLATLSMHLQAREIADKYPPTRMYSFKYPETIPPDMYDEPCSYRWNDVYNSVKDLEEWQSDMIGSELTDDPEPDDASYTSDLAKMHLASKDV